MGAIASNVQLGPEPDLSLASWQDAERLFRGLRETLVRVDQPLVLVSQTQRSGGTLLNNLLDGHPQLHVHPYELHVGHPTKYDWPTLKLGASADDWIDRLREPFVQDLFESGYRKGPDIALRERSALAFTVVPSFLERLFRVLCAERPPRRARDILDHYMTAFFNAWIDCQGLREEPKTWVAAFGPRLAWGKSRRRFLADYPDGRIVASHRDPRAWYASASRFSGRYGELDEAIELWSRGAREIVAAKAADPERVLVVTYEALVSDPERVMRHLAGWLGIGWDPILVRPTFNGQGVIANSSHGIAETGVRSESIARWRDTLDAATIATIEARALELDAAVRQIADVA
jgi:hypothetical protein